MYNIWQDLSTNALIPAAHFFFEKPCATCNGPNGSGASVIPKGSFLYTQTNPWILTLLIEEILHQLICSLSYYLQCLIHPRWCRISSINSIETSDHEHFRREIGNTSWQTHLDVDFINSRNSTRQLRGATFRELFKDSHRINICYIYLHLP